MISFPLLCVFVGTFLFVWFWNRKKSKEGFKELPGPRGYPFVGNALQIGKYMHKQINKWQDEFGDIFMFTMGTQTAVSVSDPKMVKELLSNDSNYIGRPHIDGFDIYETERLGIINSEGELWEVHRRFLLRQLRDFGFGKAAMENLILEELNEVIQKFKDSEGKPMKDIKKVFTVAVINSLWSVISQQRFKHDDPKLHKLVTNFEKVFQDMFENQLIGLVATMPTLRKVIPDSWSGFDTFRGVMEEFKQWFINMVAEHDKTYEEDNIRDFIDVYKAEVKKTTDPNSTFYGDAAERQLIATLFDLFSAGTDTTSTTIAWAILYMTKWPQYEKKFQEEIEKVTNNSRNVGIADRPNMPFTLAMIDEVLRFSSIVPNGVQHRALEDKEFQGFLIPKDAWIMPNLYYIHHDPRIWGDADKFRPERFLSADGKKYVKNENLNAFQVGRRQCVGETLARDTIFLYLTNIYQKFSIKFDKNEPEPGLDSLPNFLLRPDPYSVIMEDRMK